MVGVVAILTAFVPADQLDGADAVPGATARNLRELIEGEPQLILGRIHLQLQPGRGSGSPLGGHRRCRPGRAPLAIDAGPRLPAAGECRQGDRWQRARGSRRNVRQVCDVDPDAGRLGRRHVTIRHAQVHGVRPAWSQFQNPSDDLVGRLVHADVQAAFAVLNKDERGIRRRGALLHRIVDVRGSINTEVREGVQETRAEWAAAAVGVSRHEAVERAVSRSLLHVPDARESRVLDYQLGAVVDGEGEDQTIPLCGHCHADRDVVLPAMLGADPGPFR